MPVKTTTPERIYPFHTVNPQIGEGNSWRHDGLDGPGAEQRGITITSAAT